MSSAISFPHGWRALWITCHGGTRPSFTVCLQATELLSWERQDALAQTIGDGHEAMESGYEEDEVFAVVGNEVRAIWGAERQECESMHPMTLQFGVALARRFTAEEALQLWRVFQPVDDALCALFSESATECKGCGRNDGSYNARMPHELLELLELPRVRL